MRPEKISSSAEVIARRAVGEIAGHILDGAGNLIDHDIHRRVVGISLDDMAATDNAILAARGLHKVPILAAALRRGGVDTPVTDENTAEALLRHVGD